MKSLLVTVLRSSDGRGCKDTKGQKESGPCELLTVLGKRKRSFARAMRPSRWKQELPRRKRERKVGRESESRIYSQEYN